MSNIPKKYTHKLVQKKHTDEHKSVSLDTSIYKYMVPLSL